MPQDLREVVSSDGSSIGARPGAEAAYLLAPEDGITIERPSPSVEIHQNENFAVIVDADTAVDDVPGGREIDIDDASLFDALTQSGHEESYLTTKLSGRRIELNRACQFRHAGRRSQAAPGYVATF